MADLPNAPMPSQPFTSSLGASAILGMEMLLEEPGRTRMRMGYRAELARSNTQPVLHAGAIVTAIDSLMGMTGMRFMEATEGARSGIATLDLRYDEFSAPAPHSGVLVEAVCDRVDGDLLYITGQCLSLDGEQVHARATGRFIRTAAFSVPSPMATPATNAPATN